MSCKTASFVYREIDRQRDGGEGDRHEWLMSRAPGPLTLHDYLIPGDGAQCFRPVLVRCRGLGDAALSTCVRVRKKHAARRATDCLFHRTPRNGGINHPDMNGCTRMLDPCMFGPFRIGPCVHLPWVIVSILFFHECFKMIRLFCQYTSAHLNPVNWFCVYAAELLHLNRINPDKQTILPQV